MPQICVMNCSEREMCGSVIVEGSEIDRVGRGRGTRTLACVHAFVVVQREKERGEDWRELIDAARCAQRYLGLNSRASASGSLHLCSFLSGGRGEDRKTCFDIPLSYPSSRHMPGVGLSFSNMGFFPPSLCSVCFSVRAVFAAAPGALVRDVCLCLHHAEASAPSQRCERPQQQPLPA